MTDDELIERMVREAAELGPMPALEFERETEAIRRYAAGQSSVSGLELEHDLVSLSLARAQKEGDLISVGGPIGGPAEASG